MNQTEAARCRAALMDKYKTAVQFQELRELSAQEPAFSGLFVGSVCDAYFESPRRVMLVGQETRSWKGAKELRDTTTAPDLESYIAERMRQHERHLTTKDAGRSKFFQFYDQLRVRVSGSAAPGAVAWRNLFCLSYSKASTLRCPKPRLEQVSAWSSALLRAQIEILKPKVIFFVTGPTYDSHLKRMLTLSERRDPLVKRRLWEFKAEGILSYRTTHPRWAAGKTHRDQAISLALEALTPLGLKVA
jgi:hypothetical protein